MRKTSPSQTRQDSHPRRTQEWSNPALEKRDGASRKLGVRVVKRPTKLLLYNLSFAADMHAESNNDNPSHDTMAPKR